jgi:hypothetical protein
MRSITCIALACVAVAAITGLVACKDDDPGDIDGGDMAGDFSKPGPDMPVKTGCAGYSQCIVTCFADGGASASLSGCQTMCGKTAKTGAAMKWSAALACGQDYCLGDVDAGGNKCTLNEAMDKLIDRPGDPVDTCGHCLGDSLARLFGDACTMMSSADCNPASCMVVTDACLNDLP